MRQLLKNTFTLALALVFTAGMAFGQQEDPSANDATLDQVGNNNEATIDQLGKEDNTKALQDGDQNVLNLIQRGEGSHFADIRQAGFSNTATVTSQGFFSSNDLDIDQVGNNNETTVAHLNGEHTNTVLQDGNRNSAEISHRSSYDNTVTLVQRGNDNSLLAADEGQGANGADGSTFDARQFGNQNVGTLEHAGGNLQAFLEQDGFSNEASIIQRTAAFGETDSNFADVLQRGDNNMSTVTQGTDGNTANVQQIGNGNTSTFTQN